MSVGYLAIIIIRSRPSEVGLEDFDSDHENISSLYQDDDESYTVESDNDNEDDEFGSNEIGIWQRSKLFLNYSFFISICLVFFAIQLIKTLVSDWAQVYLIQSIKFSHYDGQFLQ